MEHLSESRFKRYICMLKEERGGFAVSQTRRARGLVQIDIHGRHGILVLQVKNLRPLIDANYKADNESLYEVWLSNASRRKGRPLNIGVLKVDRRGEGETRWEFIADNLQGTGLDIDCFNKVVVTAEGSGSRKGKQVVLAGEFELHIADSFEGLNIEKVSPFGDKMPNHQWWKFYPNQYLSRMMENQFADNPVTDNDNAAAEVSSYPPGYESGPVFRGHQLIGLHYDEKGAVNYLVHGIPGRFCAEDQPDGGESGYVCWQPLPGQDFQFGHYGYWLVHINPESGEVVFPREQTPPPDKR